MSFPDYEAAGTVFGKYVEQELRDGQHLKWEWIREAVDAALGEEPLYRIDLSGSFDIGANDSWADLFDEAKNEGLLIRANPEGEQL